MSELSNIKLTRPGIIYNIYIYYKTLFQISNIYIYCSKTKYQAIKFARKRNLGYSPVTHS